MSAVLFQIRAFVQPHLNVFGSHGFESGLVPQCRRDFFVVDLVVAVAVQLLKQVLAFLKVDVKIVHALNVVRVQQAFKFVRGDHAVGVQIQECEEVDGEGRRGVGHIDEFWLGWS